MAKKEKVAVKLPKADEVPTAKPLVEKIARAKTRLAKMRDGGAVKSDPKHRRARKKVKRAQRRLHRTLVLAGSRTKPATPEAPPAS